MSTNQEKNGGIPKPPKASSKNIQETSTEKKKKMRKKSLTHIVTSNNPTMVASMTTLHRESPSIEYGAKTVLPASSLAKFVVPYIQTQDSIDGESVSRNNNPFSMKNLNHAKTEKALKRNFSTIQTPSNDEKRIAVKPWIALGSI